MSLPYEKVEAFNLGGTLYPTEEAVLYAAVEKVFGKTGAAPVAMRNACTLVPLLTRICELRPEPAEGEQQGGCADP